MNNTHELYKILFVYDDLVQFDIRIDGEMKTLTGKVKSTDRFGTFTQNKEPSYNIYCKEYDVVFKHIKQSELRKVTAESF